MQSFWQDKEVIDLFLTVKDIKNNNKPLSFAFVLHANKYNRKHNSVKNYYYYELKNLAQNPLRQHKLGIDIDVFRVKKHINFSQQEKSTLIQTIDKKVASGKSVRSVCYTLANGDIDKMQRYQNKYYNSKKQPVFSNDQKVVNIKEHKGKVLNTLSDKDITVLFLGLVRLIKSEATKEANVQLKRECEFATANYQRALALLKQKESEVDKLKSINKTLNDQVSHLKSTNNTLLS